jgi:elongator complex protein 4
MSSFRKRNVVLSTKGNVPASQSQQRVEAQPGIKPSPVTGHATTSTGTESLDKLLGLGAGLALGSSLLIEEEGTTEFARSLLSCYAAEGVLQGHSVIVIGPEGSLNLPGLAEESKGKSSRTAADAEKMKIAWRYERLGAFGERERGGFELKHELQHVFSKSSNSRLCIFPNAHMISQDPLRQMCQMIAPPKLKQAPHFVTISILPKSSQYLPAVGLPDTWLRR